MSLNKGLVETISWSESICDKRNLQIIVPNLLHLFYISITVCVGLVWFWIPETVMSAECQCKEILIIASLKKNEWKSSFSQPKRNNNYKKINISKKIKTKKKIDSQSINFYFLYLPIQIHTNKYLWIFDIQNWCCQET